MTETTNHPSKTLFSQQKLAEQLLNDIPLLAETHEHVFQVVGVLESYGIVLDAYSRNLVDQGKRQLLNPLPILRFFHEGLSITRLWQHLVGDRINFEYAEYCQKAMFWHGTGGMDAYFDTEEFLTACHRATSLRCRRDPLLAILNYFCPGFAIESIRSLTTIYALGLFWRVMSDLFIDLAHRYRSGEVITVQDIVHHVRDGLVSAATKPITYSVRVSGELVDLLPPEAGLTFLPDVAAPYVEAVFLRGTPFLGTVSYNAQARQISPDISQFCYGALYADPLPSMSAGIPPSLCMQDMFRNLPSDLSDWYSKHARGPSDIHVQICTSFQKSMFCVTNGVILGTFPYPLDSDDLEARQANTDYAESWAKRLLGTRLDALN